MLSQVPKLLRKTHFKAKINTHSYFQFSPFATSNSINQPDYSYDETYQPPLLHNSKLIMNISELLKLSPIQFGRNAQPTQTEESVTNLILDLLFIL